MTISIIVPVHNGGEAFARCLAGIAALAPAPHELIVVADGESDGAWRKAEAYGAHILHFETASGPAFARNQGAQVATGEVLFFLDADVVPAPNAIAEIQAAFLESPELTALVGSYDDAPGAPSFLSQYRNLLHHYVHQQANEEGSTFWGACAAIYRRVFLDVGGFNEDYSRPSIEDIEFGYRLKAAGHQIRLRKTLQVKHLKHWGAVNMLRTDFFQRALPWTALILRSGRFDNDLNLRYNSRLSVVSVFVLLGALLSALVWPLAGWLAALAALSLLLLNADLYGWFLRKRGLFFTLRVLPWHWLYYFYSGVAFGVGLVRHTLTRSALPSPNPDAA